MKFSTIVFFLSIAALDFVSGKPVIEKRDVVITGPNGENLIDSLPPGEKAIINARDVTSPLLAARHATPPVCKSAKIKKIVDVLKSKKATPFCSSFLKIPVKTSTIRVTKSSTITVTSGVVQYSTITVVDRTDTLSFTESTTVATEPTVVETSVIPSVSIFTSTVTPAEQTVSTTIYTTPLLKARNMNNIEERANVKIPSYCKAYPSASVSQACSCLSIPTSTVRKTSVIHTTITVQKTTTATAIRTAYSTTETSTTLTVELTSYEPTTTYTTSVTISTVVETAPIPTKTVTIEKDLPPECMNIISGGKLFTQAAPGRNVGPGPAELRRFFAERTDYTWSQCCGYAFTELKNIGVLFFSDRGAAVGAERFACNPWISLDSLSTGVTDQCPMGQPLNPTASGRGSTGFLLGPCFGINPTLS